MLCINLRQEEKGHLAFGVWAAKRVIEFEGEKGHASLQSALPKFMRMGLGFAGRPSDESENFGLYFDLGLKVRTASQIQEEYLDLLQNRLAELNLKIPANVEPDYEMKVGYDLAKV